MYQPSLWAAKPMPFLAACGQQANHAKAEQQRRTWFRN
jgi:hypothetical protein